MTGIKVVGSAIIVTSRLSIKDIDLAERFTKEAVILTNTKGEPVFRLGVGSSTAFSENGIQFVKDNADGKAEITLTDPELAGLTAEQKKALIEKNFATIFCKLDMTEDNVLAAITSIKETFDKTMENVVVE